MKEFAQNYAEFLWLLAGYIGLELKNYVLKIIKTRKAKQKSELNTDIGVLMRKKNEIENYCVVILDQTKASHVGLWRFSNGQTYLNGDSIKKMSLYTEAAINDGLLIDDITQKLDLENFSKSIQTLLNSESKFINLIEGKVIDGSTTMLASGPQEWIEMDWHCKKLMKQRSYTSMIWVLLMDHTKKPVGILEISFIIPIDYRTINSVKIAEYKQDLEFKLEGKLV